MKQMPKIEKYMTPMPHTINAGLPLKMAKEMMSKYGIRHLPVQEGGKLVGVITDRDLKLAYSMNDQANFLVDDVMTPDSYAVEPQENLDTVLTVMAERKLGCAVVAQENGKVVGIFTATDGLRAFSEVLHTRFKQ